MDSFEANKIFGALLGTVFVLFGGSLLAESIFHSELPEQPGYIIEAPEEGEGGAVAEEAAVPIAALLQEADAEAGSTIFRRCQSCHSAEEGAPAGVGPHLWGVVNRPIASDPGFSYSAAMTEFSQGGSVVWDYEHLSGFLHNPRQYVPGTAMSFAGISNDADRADLIAYLRTLASDPAPLPEPPAEGEAAPAEGEAAPAEGAAPAEDEAAAPAGEAAPAAGGAEVTAPGATTDPSQPASDQPQAPAVTDPAAGAAPISENPTTGQATDPAAAQPSQTPPAQDGLAPTEDPAPAAEGAAPAPGGEAPAQAQPAPAAEPAPAAQNELPAAAAPGGSQAATPADAPAAQPAPAPQDEAPTNEEPQGTTIVPAQ